VINNIADLSIEDREYKDHFHTTYLKGKI
jgi:hypothetical protein